MYVTAVTIAATAALAWPISRNEPAHRAFAGWATAMAAAHLAVAIAPQSVALAVASASLASLGLWGVCVMAFGGGRGVWIPWLAALLALSAAHPEVPATIREGAIRAVWTLGAAATWVCIGRALLRDEEPKPSHLVIMIFAAVTAMRAAIADATLAAEVPLVVGALGATAAQLAWIGRVRAHRAGEEARGDANAVDGGDVDVRGDDRMGDLVDVAEAIRRRREREARARGGLGEA